jgi:hypothetical protein
MKSIQNIDLKLNALEKRVKRQGLEIAALNNKVFDRGGIYGNVLYPTGMFVEDFGTLVGSLTNDPYFTAAIDNVSKVCRPAFSADAHKLMFVTDPDVSYKNDIVTMKVLGEEKFISQTKPTTTSVVTPTDTRFNSVVVANYPQEVGTNAAADAADAANAANNAANNNNNSTIILNNTIKSEPLNTKIVTMTTTKILTRITSSCVQKICTFETTVIGICFVMKRINF